MTEQIVEVEIKAKPSFVVAVKTPEGLGKLTFKNLKQNHLTKLQIDLEKNFQAGIEKIYQAVNSVENLFDDGEAVTLEQINSGEISTELAAAIFQAFIKVITAKNTPVDEAEIKKDSAAIDLAAA